MSKLSTSLSMIKTLVAVSVGAALLTACVGVVPAPAGGWEVGHYKKSGRWVPGRYTGDAVPGTTWVAGHTGRFGQWVPGHWM